jgi:hypothetical protein
MMEASNTNPRKLRAVFSYPWPRDDTPQRDAKSAPLSSYPDNRSRSYTRGSWLFFREGITTSAPRFSICPTTALLAYPGQTHLILPLLRPSFEDSLSKSRHPRSPDNAWSSCSPCSDGRLLGLLEHRFHTSSLFLEQTGTCQSDNDFQAPNCRRKRRSLAQNCRISSMA